MNASSSSYYHITALPALGELGSAPPMEPIHLLERLADSPRSGTLVEVLLLHDDLLLIIKNSDGI